MSFRLRCTETDCTVPHAPGGLSLASFEDKDKALQWLGDAGSYELVEVTYAVKWYDRDGKPWPEVSSPWRSNKGVAKKAEATRFNTAKEARAFIRPEGKPGFGGCSSGYRVIRLVNKVRE